MNARQIIERLIENYAAGRMDEAFADLDENFRFHWNAEPGLATYSARGVDGRSMRARLDHLHDIYEYLVYRPTMIVAEGDHVAVQLALKLRDKSTGAVLDMAAADFWTVREGRIVELVEYYDTALVESVEAAARR